MVPEQLAVIDADEAEDGHRGRDERTDEGGRLAGRPRVPRVQRVVAADAPQVESEGADDHRHRDEVELRGGELRPLQRREPRVGERGDHLMTLPPPSAVLPDALADPPLAVQGGRIRGGPAPRRSCATRARPRSPRPGTRFLAPGMGTAPWATSQARATWLGVRPPWASPDAAQLRHDLVDLGHRVGRERAAARGRVGRRVLAGEAPLPDGRVGQGHHAELAAAVESPTRSGMRPQERELHLVAGEPEAARAQGGVHGARLLGRVVGDADRPHQSLGFGGGQSVGQRAVGAQRDRPVDLVQVDGLDAQPVGTTAAPPRAGPSAR